MYGAETWTLGKWIRNTWNELLGREREDQLSNRVRNEVSQRVRVEA